MNSNMLYEKQEKHASLGNGKKGVRAHHAVTSHAMFTHLIDMILNHKFKILSIPCTYNLHIDDDMWSISDSPGRLIINRYENSIIDVIEKATRHD